MSYEREGDWLKKCAENTRRWDRKKRKHKLRYFLHFWCVYWLVGCCISQSMAISIPGTWRLKKCIFWPPQSLTAPLRAAVHPESLKALNEWWHSTRTTCPAAASHRIISKHWMTAFQQDVTSISHWWGLPLQYMYGIDYIHYLSTTNHRPETRYPTTLITIYIAGTSQLLRRSIWSRAPVVDRSWCRCRFHPLPGAASSFRDM